MKTPFEITAVALAAAALAGCATSHDFSKQAMTANLAIEEATNQALLINVVRGMKRRPMHFSAIQSINGPAGYGAPTLTIPLPVGPASATGYALSGTYKPDTASFTVSPLDTQEFVRGITTPLPAKTFAYYLDQGWPATMLFHLLIREIQIFRMNDNEKVRVARFTNYPQNQKDFDQFQEAVEQLVSCGPEAGIETGTDRYGAQLTNDKASDLRKLAEAKKAEIKLEPVYKDKTATKHAKDDEIVAYWPTIEDKTVVIKLSTDPCYLTLPHPVQTDGMATAAKLTSKDKIALAGVAESGPSEAQRTKEAMYQISLKMRSPEAVAYYLGELARAQVEGVYPEEGAHALVKTKPPKIRLGKSETVELFVVQETEPADTTDAVLAVKYDNKRYIIPQNESGSSMHALSLLNQILNLQKKAADLPGPASVRIVQ